MHVNVYSQLRCCAPLPVPLSGASTSIAKAAVPSSEFDLCCSGSSAWGQLWPRELGLGVSLCTDLIRGPDGCLVSCLGFSRVFWLVGLVFPIKKLQHLCTEQQGTESLEVS